jgi:hypothetical protein
VAETRSRTDSRDGDRATRFGGTARADPDRSVARKLWNLLEIHSNRRRAGDQSSKRVHDGEPILNSRRSPYLIDFIAPA